MSDMPKIPEHAKMRAFHDGYPDEPTEWPTVKVDYDAERGRVNVTRVDAEAEHEYTDAQNLVAVWRAIRRVLGDPAARLISDSIAVERANERARAALSREPA